MTKNQKIATVILAVIVLLIIFTSQDKGEKSETKSVVATSTKEIKSLTVILPETDDQTIELLDGQGTYSVTPTASVKGKVSVSDKLVEQGDDRISVVYQDPGGDSTYGWLVLFVKGENSYDQESTLFLGENVLVNDIKAVPGDGGYNVLVDMTSTISPTGSSTVATIQNSALSVIVRNSTFDLPSTTFLK